MTAWMSFVTLGRETAAGCFAAIRTLWPLAQAGSGYRIQVPPSYRLGRSLDGQGRRTWAALDARGFGGAGLDNSSVADRI